MKFASLGLRSLRLSCGGCGATTWSSRSSGRRRRRTGAGDRDRRAGVRRQPDLGQHPHRRLRALDRHRADDPGAVRVAVPSQMSGQPIRAEGRVDSAAMESLGERMAVISERRGPVIGVEPAGLAACLGLGACSSLGGGRPASAVQARRAQRRLPAAGAAARRRARAEPGSRTAAGDVRGAAARGADARRCSAATGRLPLPRASSCSPTRST